MYLSVIYLKHCDDYGNGEKYGRVARPFSIRVGAASSDTKCERPWRAGAWGKSKNTRAAAAAAGDKLRVTAVNNTARKNYTEILIINLDGNHSGVVIILISPPPYPFRQFSPFAHGKICKFPPSLGRNPRPTETVNLISQHVRETTVSLRDRLLLLWLLLFSRQPFFFSNVRLILLVLLLLCTGARPFAFSLNFDSGDVQPRVYKTCDFVDYFNLLLSRRCYAANGATRKSPDKFHDIFLPETYIYVLV